MIFALGLLAQFALLLFSILREVPSFWLNSGGYPEWLRSLVGIGYYPFLGVVTALHWGLPPWRRSQRGLDWFLWSVSTLLWLLSLLCAGWNNLENLLDGRPLHWHQE